MVPSSSRRRRSRPLVLAACALTALIATGIGIAASLGVTSAKLTTYVAASTVPCTSPGAQTASANADSWINQSSASSNFGTDAILKVRTQSGSANYRALVRFTLPSTPAGCTVTAATLRLYAASAATGRTLQVLRVNASWTETGVTWTNQPATTGTAATTASGTGWRQWTVTSQVQSMYSGSNNGFLVRDQTESGSGAEQSLHSREKAPDNPPQLLVTFG